MSWRSLELGKRLCSTQARSCRSLLCRAESLVSSDFSGRSGRPSAISLVGNGGIVSRDVGADGDIAIGACAGQTESGSNPSRSVCFGRNGGCRYPRPKSCGCTRRLPIRCGHRAREGRPEFLVQLGPGINVDYRLVLAHIFRPISQAAERIWNQRLGLRFLEPLRLTRCSHILSQSQPLLQWRSHDLHVEITNRKSIEPGVDLSLGLPPRYG